MQEEEEAMIKREREREVKLINRLILTKIKRERRGCGQSGCLNSNGLSSNLAEVYLLFFICK